MARTTDGEERVRVRAGPGAAVRAGRRSNCDDAPSGRSLHWFWGAVIGVAATCAYGGLAVSAPGFQRINERLSAMIESRLPGGSARQYPSWQTGAAVAIVYFLPAAVVGFAASGLVTRWLGGRKPPDRETRCRRCGYILRGISEPRCSECGERI